MDAMPIVAVAMIVLVCSRLSYVFYALGIGRPRIVWLALTAGAILLTLLLFVH